MACELEELYRLYLECFPHYPIKEAWFFDLLKPEKATLLQERREGELAGFSLIHGNAIALLCVKASCRRQGIGSKLLALSEEHIARQGETCVILGQARWYLLQGVPLENPEAVPFFEHRGYTAAWTSVNMLLPLQGYDPASVSIPPAPQELSFRLLEEEDTPRLLQAVENAQHYWLDCFHDYHGLVLGAELNGKLVGFEMVDPEGGRFIPSSHKVGSIGCVGVVKEAREQGIGMQMVLEGIKWLQRQGSGSVELLYVALVDWYRKLGFQVNQRQWMGQKALEKETLS